MHSRAGNTIRVLSSSRFPVNEWTHVTVTYDGTSKARGVTLYVNGTPSSVEVSATTSRARIMSNGGGTLGDEFVGFSFGRRFRMTTMKDGALDELRLYKRALTPAEVRFLHAGQAGRTAPSPAARSRRCSGRRRPRCMRR